MPILASEGCFWPLTASITSEAKINYAYVTTQGICNNFIEVNFCMGPMVSEPNRLFQHSTTMSLINKISFHAVVVFGLGKDLLSKSVQGSTVRNYLPPAERTAKLLNDNKDLVAIPEAIINLPERLEIESGQPPLSTVVVLK